VEQQKNIVRQMFAEETGWEFPRLLDEMCDASDFYFDDVSLIRGQGRSMAIVGVYVLAGELASAGDD
jgi:hypothetical protein